MLIGGIPTSMKGMSIYLNAMKELGIVDVELPNLQSLSDTLTGAGIAGEIEANIQGLFKSMEMKLTSRAVAKTMAPILVPGVHNLTFRGIVDVLDSSMKIGAGNRNIRVVANVQSKGVNLGKGEMAKGMGTEYTFEVLSMALFLDEVPVILVDKLNWKYEVLGKEYLDPDSFL